ncbi:MAG: hypothetical protein UV97_C0019G0003, partial [Candidatus Yanofskybacteria bacterium GW2011_GWF2_43_596]
MIFLYLDGYDLGSTTKEWGNLYLGDIGKMYLGLSQDTNLYRVGADKLGTDDSFVAGGNVGIGTTNPGYKLDVQQSITGTDATISIFQNHALSYSGSAGGTGSAYILNFSGVATGATNINQFNGNVSNLYNQTSATIATMQGNTSGIRLNNSGNTTNAIGFTATPILSSTGSITTSYKGFYAQSPSISGAGTIASSYGLYSSNQGQANVTNAYGLYIENQTGSPTLNYALYSAGGMNYFAGNVGIGSVTPGAKLDVNGLIRTSSHIEYAGGGYLTAGGRFYLTGDTSNQARISSDASGANLSTLLVGNLGVGTTTPAFKLDVVGSGKFSDELIIANSIAIGTTATSSFNRIGAGTPTSPLITTTDDLFIGGDLEVIDAIIGNLTSNTSSISGNFEVGGIIEAADGTAVAPSYTFNNDMNTGLFRPGSDIIGFTNGGAEKMRIDPNGNVGIGTTNPATFKLEVAGDIGPSADLTYNLGSSGRRFNNIYADTITASVSGVIVPTGFSAGPVVFGATGGSLAQDNALFWDNTNKRLGIGTTAPAVPLHVSASAPTTDYVTRLINTQGTRALGLLVQTNTASATTSDPMLKVVAGANTIFNLQTDGKLGLGTATPATTLHLSTAIGEVFRTSYSSDNTYYHSLLAGYSATAAADYWAFKINNGTANTQTEVLRLVGDGNVGIGSTAPAQALDLGASKKNIKFSGYTHIGETGSDLGAVFGNNIRASTSVNGQIEISANATDAAHAIRMVYSDGIRFISVPQSHGFAAGTAVAPATYTKMRLTTAGGLALGNSYVSTDPGAGNMIISGNVGIGTTNPSAKLDFGTNTGEKIVLYPNTASNNYGIGVQSNLLQIHTNSATDRVGIGYGSSSSFTETLSVKGSNVGIGTTSPTALLDVAGAATINSLTLDANTGTALSISGTSFATDISLQNGETIDNDTDGRIRFIGNTLTSGNTYFANGTTYYVDTAGTANFNNAYAGRYYQSANGVPTSNLGSPSVTEMALFDTQFNNKTEFYNISNVYVETSTDGSIWSDAGATDDQKRKLVGGDSDSSLVIPYGTNYFRVRFRSTSYVYLNALYSYWSSNGHTTQVQIYKQHDSGAYTQHTSSTAAVSAWPGHLYMPFATIPFHPAGTLGTHYHEVSVVFIPSWNGAYPSNNINISRMQLWGGYPAGKRTIYSADEYQNVTFPGNITLSPASGVLSFSSSTGAKQITTGGTTNLALMPGGNVGIGTTTPGAKLEVNGQVKITGGTPGANKV